MCETGEGGWLPSQTALGGCNPPPPPPLVVSPIQLISSLGLTPPWWWRTHWYRPRVLVTYHLGPTARWVERAGGVGGMPRGGSITCEWWDNCATLSSISFSPAVSGSRADSPHLSVIFFEPTLSSPNHKWRISSPKRQRAHAPKSNNQHTHRPFLAPPPSSHFFYILLT